MLGLVPLHPSQFDKLIGKSTAMRKKLKRDGDLQPLIVGKPVQKADGLWRDQILLWGDAIILESIALLVKAGAAHKAVRYAMNDIQLAIIGAFNALDVGQDVELAFAHDGKHFVVVTAADVPQAMRLVADHFVKLGITSSEKLAYFCVPLRLAYNAVRSRAAKHKIRFPARVWPTPEELDAGVDLLAVAIGPRSSPMITRWRKARAAERGELHVQPLSPEKTETDGVQFNRRGSFKPGT
jgi:hypothetical protein